jgi:hypothetical protein
MEARLGGCIGGGAGVMHRCIENQVESDPPGPVGLERGDGETGLGGCDLR